MPLVVLLVPVAWWSVLLVAKLIDGILVAVRHDQQKPFSRDSGGHESAASPFTILDNVGPGPPEPTF